MNTEIIDKIKTELSNDEELKDIKFNIHEITISKTYETLEFIMDNKIRFVQIISGLNEAWTEDDVINHSIEIARKNLNAYKKLDRDEIIKNKKTITFLDQTDPMSYHKLTTEELADKMNEYEIKDKEFKKVIA
ncbi:MAG: hypothetical protein ACOC1O_00345 [bacterium]